MSEGSLGNLKWVLDADDSAFNAKLDRSLERVMEWKAKVSGITGSIGGPPTSTFGGAPISGGNAFPVAASPSILTGASTATSQMDRAREIRDARADSRAYAMMQDFQMGRGVDINEPVGVGPLRSAGGARGGTRGGGFFGAPSGIGLLMSGMFGGWELAKAFQTGMVGQTAIGLAQNDVERMKAMNMMVQGQWGGVFASSIGLAMDVVGEGPTSLLQQVATNTARVQAGEGRAIAQMQLANIRRITGFGQSGTDAFRRREATAVGEFDLFALQADKEIADAKHIVDDRGTHFEQTSWLLPYMGRNVPNISAEERDVAQNNLQAAQARRSTAAIALSSTLTENFNAMQDYMAEQGAGARGTLRQAELIRASAGATPLQQAMATLNAVRSGSPDAVMGAIVKARGTNAFGITGFGPSLSPNVTAEIALQQAKIREAEVQVQDAKNQERAQGIAVSGQLEAASYTLMRNPLAAALAQNRAQTGAAIAAAGGLRIGFGPLGAVTANPAAINALAIGTANAALTRQQYEDQATDIALNQQTRGNQIQAALAGNFVGAQAIGISGAAQARAASLARAGLGTAAQRELQLGQGELELTAQNYLRRFHGEQVGYLEVGAPGREGLDNPRTVLATIDAEKQKLGALDAAGDSGDEKSPALLKAIENAIIDLQAIVRDLASD